MPVLSALTALALATPGKNVEGSAPFTPDERFKCSNCGEITGDDYLKKYVVLAGLACSRCSSSMCVGCSVIRD